MGTQEFFLLMKHYRAGAEVKFQTPQILRGVGEKCLKKIFLFLWAKCAIEQISETAGDINLLFAPDC